MVVVRSASTTTCSEPGRDADSRGSSARMRLTVSITLLPGCRWMFRMTAGTVRPSTLAHAASLEFSAASTTVPTSISRIGAPLR